MGVAFVDCPPERIPSVQSFFADMYWPTYILSQDESFLRWQFGPTPASRNASADYHLILGLVDDQIKGCLGYIPVDLTACGRVYRSAWAANWMVDESTRRLGMGPLLMRELTKRFDITLALGGNRDAHDLLPRMGWTDFGWLSRYVRVLDVEAAAQLTEPAELRWPLYLALAAPDLSEGSVTQVDAFGGDATTLWDSGAGVRVAGTRRSAEFLNWRYANHPTFTHRLFERRRGGRLTGLAVVRIEQVRDMPVRVARILELLTDDGRLASLLGAVVEDAAAEGAAIADFFCGTRRFDSALREAGFFDGSEPSVTRIPMLFQPLDRGRAGILFMAHLQKAREVSAASEWYVTKSDGDQDRPS